ncbi:MAG: ATP synthase F1 subunit epsilon [Lachnospiraceae bacterium]|jgi:F-type H+-transporting ATPase subunit epsilon|nr:ATP synthase F1 subunit epsilon [Lachnospiraceae bacterium]MEE3461995.1 ATP synthase F1 subunit epsilon [Lachnospiraceae bacterium]
MAKLFDLNITACNRVFYSGKAESIVFPAYDGEMAVLANHEPMTSTVEIGELRFKDEQGTWQECVVSDGLIEVKKNVVKVIVFSCEKPEEIDTFRAEQALERAKEKQAAKQSIREYNRANAAVARAMARLKAARRHHDYI